MNIKIRTTDSWIEVSEREAERLLCSASYYAGVSVMNHNAFMAEYYPIEEERSHENQVLCNRTTEQTGGSNDY